MNGWWIGGMGSKADHFSSNSCLTNVLKHMLWFPTWQYVSASGKIISAKIKLGRSGGLGGLERMKRRDKEKNVKRAEINWEEGKGESCCTH